MKLVINDAALRKLLRTSPQLRQQLAKLGREGVEYAKSIAPVGDPAVDTHSGLYRDSLVAEIHVGPSRMSLRIKAKDPKAWWIEYGAAHMPKRRVLGRTMDHVQAS